MPSLSSERLETRNSPYINRFLQPDTVIPDLSNPQGWNRYSYVMNRPINLNDPTGHDPWWSDPDFHYADTTCHLGGDTYCLLNNGAIIDESHYRPGQAIWGQIQRQVQKGKDQVIFESGFFTDKNLIKAQYDLTGIAKKDQPGVGLAILWDFEIKLEKAQYQKHPKLGAHSTFNTEDISSVALGYLAEANDITYENLVYKLGGGKSSKTKPLSEALFKAPGINPPEDCTVTGCGGTNSYQNANIYMKAYDKKTGMYNNILYPPSIDIKPIFDRDRFLEYK